MNKNNNFVGQITDLRQKRGIPIRELADRCGIAPSTITRMQSGKISPSIDVVQKILTELDAELIIKEK